MQLLQVGRPSSHFMRRFRQAKNRVIFNQQELQARGKQMEVNSLRQPVLVLFLILDFFWCGSSLPPFTCPGGPAMPWHMASPDGGIWSFIVQARLPIRRTM